MSPRGIPQHRERFAHSSEPSKRARAAPDGRSPAVPSRAPLLRSATFAGRSGTQDPERTTRRCRAAASPRVVTCALLATPRRARGRGTPEPYSERPGQSNGSVGPLAPPRGGISPRAPRPSSSIPAYAGPPVHDAPKSHVRVFLGSPAEAGSPVRGAESHVRVLLRLIPAYTRGSWRAVERRSIPATVGVLARPASRRTLVRPRVSEGHNSTVPYRPQYCQPSCRARSAVSESAGFGATRSATTFSQVTEV